MKNLRASPLNNATTWPVIKMIVGVIVVTKAQDIIDWERQKCSKAELNSVYPLVIWLQYRYLVRVLPLYLYTLAAHVFPIRIANPRRAVRHALRFNITICRVSPQVTVSSLKATQQTLTYENAMPINLTDIPGPDI